MPDILVTSDHAFDSPRSANKQFEFALATCLEYITLSHKTLRSPMAFWMITGPSPPQKQCGWNIHTCYYMQIGHVSHFVHQNIYIGVEGCGGYCTERIPHKNLIKLNKYRNLKCEPDVGILSSHSPSLTTPCSPPSQHFQGKVDDPEALLDLGLD